MDLLRRLNGEIVENLGLDRELLQLIEELHSTLGSRQQVVLALKGFLFDPDSQPAVGELLGVLDIDTDSLRAFLDENSAVIRLLFGNISDLIDQEIRWPLRAEASSPAASGTVALSGSAEMRAEIDVDGDGEALDGAIRFDAASQVLTGLSLHGEVAGEAKSEAPVGSVETNAAFGLGSEVTMENFFVHQSNERAISALRADLANFKLPGQIDSLDDLDHAIRDNGLVIIPEQYVRLAGTGRINVGGGLSWGRSFLTTGNISSSAIDLDTQIEVDTGLNASFGFTYALEGTFDLLISASADHPGLVSVRVTRSRSSQSTTSFKVGADIGITGLDQVARSVLDTFLPKMNELVAVVEDRANQLSDLRKLLATSLDEQLDELLASTNVDDKLDELLKEIGKNGGLQEQLKALVSSRVLGIADEQIDALDRRVADVRKAIKKVLGSDIAPGFPGLRGILTQALDKRLDKLLASTELDDEIQRWLEKIAAKGGLTASFKQLVEEAAVGAVGEQLDDLQGHLTPLVKMARELIAKYRAVVARINREISRAAEIKIGVEFARIRQRMSRRDIELDFAIDVEQHPDLYRQMLWGDFSAALQAVREKHPGLFVSGTHSQTGSLSINEQLNISAFGFAFNQGTILNQTWESTVSVAGDLTLSVEGTLKTVDSWLKSSRTFTFFADARVAGLMASDGTEHLDKVASTVSLELAREDWRPKREKLRDYAASLERLGVTSGPTTMEADLLPPTARRAPCDLEASAVLKLTQQDLETFLGAGLERAQTIFVQALSEFVITTLRSRLDLADAEGIPVLLWPSVRAEAAEFPHEGPRELFDTAGEISVVLSSSEQTLVAFYSRQVNLFSTLYEELGALRSVVTTSADPLAAVRASNRKVLRAVKKMLPTLLVDRYRVAQAIFRTVFVLANREGQLDPVAVVRHTEDDRVFVYG